MKKFAFYPGCVSRGACPELFDSTVAVCKRLGIELIHEPLEGASCTGAGVLQEKNQKLGDTLNARTFAMVEKTGLPLLTICSTCQGVMAQANHRLRSDKNYLDEINRDLADENLQYSGSVEPKHLLWVLFEDIGVEYVKSQFTRSLKGFKFAPFYGCYIVRPSDVLALDANPDRKNSLEQIIEATGAELVDFPGKTACCGFPILLINETNSTKMVGNHTLSAKRKGADAMVTPCPLCHLNLDGYQPNASLLRREMINLPILHLPQLLGLALGIEPTKLKLNRHIISTKKLISTLSVTP